MSTTKVALYDVDDVEGLAREAMETRLRQWGARLNEHEKEDALSYLIATALELAHAYDPSKGLSFSTYCYRMLRFRLADWYRDRFGDSRHGTRPPELPGDDEMARIEDPRDVIEQTLSVINTQRLTPHERRTLELIAKPMAFGDLKMTDVADRLGWTRRRVSKELGQLREALAA